MEKLNETKEALFNAGLAKLERIDLQRRMMQSARIYHNWEVFSDCLYNIRTEINERMDDDERKKADNYEKDMKVEMDKYKDKRVRKVKNVQINITPLIGYERYLGDLEYKFKMSLPDKGEDEGL